MADLTYDSIWDDYKPRAGRESYVVTDGETLFAGMLTKVAGGFLTKWDDGIGSVFAGILLEGAVGDTSADDPPQGRVNDHGDNLRNVPIAGLVAGDVGAEVYCASSNLADCAKTGNVPIGMITKFRSAGVGDIRLYTPTEVKANA